MKKRRIASARHMSKDDRRRLQLNKRLENHEEVKRAEHAMFARPDGSKKFVRANSNEAVRAPLNKRLIALILAIVMVVGLIPTGIFLFKPKAEEVNKAMESVVMSVRVNGQETGTTAVVKPGEITAGNINLGDYELPEDVGYVKAVVYDSDTESETQIFSVGQKNGTDYYSITQNSYTGVAKANSDRLILDFANKYNLHFNGTEANGTFIVPDDGSYTTNAIKDTSDGSWFIYGGQNLVIKEITPDADRTVSRVTYTSAKSSGTERIKNSTATIPANMITGETTVNVTFNEISSYSVQDARYMSGSKYYSQYYNLDNHGGTSQSLSSRSDANSLDSVSPGEDAVFYVYSQKNTTNQQLWKLSMLSINGVDLKFPADGSSSGATETTPFDENRDITVEFISDTEDFNESGDRTVYKITVPDVHENIEVNYYFTNIKERKLIVKGLTGINKTAASVENYALTGNWFGKWYTYTSNKQNVYDAFYDSRSNYPADNLVLYTVKPGYNPYAITTSMINGQTGASINIRATSTTGSPQDVIKVAGNQSGSGNFDTDWRHWGRNTVGLQNNEDTYGVPRKVELLLTTIDKDTNNTWYAVALAQSTAMNQQLYLNAPMYPYAFAFDLDADDANLEGSYSTDGDYLVDSNNLHYIDGDDNYGYLPTKAPTRSGYEFVGWVMLDAEGNMLNELEYTYQPSDRIDIDEETIGYAYGDKTSADNSAVQQIRFVAKWTRLKTADTTVSVTTKVQNGISNGTKTYTTIVNGDTEQQIAGDTALLNDGSGVMGDMHYVINSDSDIVLTTNESGTNNDFLAIYDYNLLDFTVKNTVLGYPKTQRFEITVTLTKSEDSPVNLALGQELISATLNDEDQTTFTPVVDSAAGTLTYTLYMTRDQQVVFEDVPYGWTYTVAEDAKENDYAREISSESGTIEKDMEVEVTNMSDNSELHTTKTISFNESTGKYDLKLEAWATGDKISKYDKEPVPTDIALVIDQSGSMATTDMNPTYGVAESGKTSWTVSEATSGKQYYVKVNGKYYPVHAGEGTLYENVGKPKVKTLVGSGHNDFSAGVNGVPSYINIKTNYYYPDSSGTMRRVYTTSSGCALRFECVQYYFTSDAYENSANYGEKDEYLTSNYYVGSWSAARLRYYYLWGNDESWTTWYNNNAINYIGPSHSIRDSVGNDIMVSWNWLGRNETVKYDLYQIKDGTNYNHLYYVNDQGKAVTFSSTANLEDDVVYSDVLYETTGESRVYALQDAVKEFVEMVADNATTNNVDHRISMIGFAGSQTPGISTTGGVWHATPNSYSNYYDYVNTGLFLQGNFQNYKTITSFSETSDSYINRHYYVNNTNSSYPYNKISYSSYSLVPVLYNGSNWQFLGTSTTTTGTKYEANYDNLTDQNYLNSLVSVSPTTGENVTDTNSLAKDTTAKTFVIDSSSDNGVNDYLDTAITQFGSYGGTYTSYGMAMANQVLELAKEQDASRQRIIIVFTDGEPGANGYDSAIANEALFDSNDSKSADSLDAKVYTIGLYTGNVSTQVKEFMQKLSSEYSSAETTKVYSGNKDGVNSSLDNTKTYYYKDSTENKTYSVTAVRNGVQTLGWWSKTGSDSTGYVYSKYEPMSANDEWDSDTPGYNYNIDTVAFYTSASGSRTKNGAVYGSSINTSNTYYLYDGTEVNYENRWYDSNNRIRDPLRYEGDTEGAGNRYQFYDMGSSNLSSDGETYYYAANDADALKEAFAQISDSMVKSTVALDGSNSVLRDVVTANFANVASRDVDVYTVPGTYNTSTDRIDWDEDNHGSFSGNKSVSIDPSNSEQSLIEVDGFDYSTKYITPDHAGEKIVVTISNLEPEALGYELESNTNASGIIEKTTDEDNNPVENLLYPFDIPKVNRYQHNLKVEGADTTTNYGMKLVLTPKEEGGTIPSSLTAYYRSTNDEDDAANMGHDYDSDAHTLTFTNGVATWPSNAQADNFSSLILEDLDDAYLVSAMVDAPAASTYDYTLALDNRSKQFGTAYQLDREKTQTTKIDSTIKTVDVVIKEITQGTDSGNDYSDKGKPFDIEVTLVNNGTEVDDDVTYGDTTYTDGKLILSLRDEQSRVIQVPEGYSIKVCEVDSGEYTDSYTKVYTEDDNETSIDKSEIVAVGSTYTRITVYNTLDTTPQTGMFDNLKINPFVFAGICAALIGAIWLAVLQKRKRQMNER